MSKHTIQELYQWQSLPLNVKILMTKERIREWVREYGEDGVYVSFSGGKDSTVLLDLVRQDYPDVPAVFVDVPTQYPELREFAKTWDNVEIIRPKTTFFEVCEKYGFPLISKEVSECVSGARKYLQKILDTEYAESKILTDRQTDRQTDSNISISTKRLQEQVSMVTIPSADKQSLIDNTRGGTTTSIENYEELKTLTKNKGNARLKMIMGVYPSRSGGTPKDNKSQYSQEKYQFFLEAPFEISNQCCTVMKKKPAHDYSKSTGKKAITAEMASESRLRTQKWVQNGCNGFNLTIPKSTPMAFWTEQDILQYIYDRKLPICSVYGDIVPAFDKEGQLEGQMRLDDLDSEKFGIFDLDRPMLKTTGCKRTGCMLCGFGCHMSDDTRFLQLKETHPKMYDLLDKVTNNGVTMREAIEWTNKNGNLNIKL